MATLIRMHGVQEALFALRELPRRVQIKHLRIALNAGGGILKNTAKSLAPKETRLLRNSLGVKVKIPDASYNASHHGRPAYVVVGPRRNFVRASSRTAGGRARLLSDRKALRTVLSGGRVAVRNPARYAHLVEMGTRPHLIAARNRRVLSNGARTFGTRARVSARPKPFLRTTVAVSGEAAKRKVTDKLRSGVLSEAASLART